MRFHVCLLVVLYGLTACQNPTPIAIDKQAERYFPQTGYIVQAEFLHFYEVYGGEASLGHPLSEVIEVGGWTVQYFERGRLEYHPENEPRYLITVGWLGELLNRRQPPLPQANQPSAIDNRLYFPKTGHTLAGDFLAYYEAYGGSVRFGLPISEPFYLDGQITQDFQSARFFWEPLANPPVILEDIGRVHLEAIDMNR